MNLQAFWITTLAGISTLLGFLILWTKKEGEIIPSSLGFSAGVMLFVSLFDLIPSSLTYFRESYLQGFHILFCLLFILLGGLISFFLNDGISQKYQQDSLYRIGFLSMLAIMLHNIPEGIITYLTTTIELKTGLLLSLSIACHNIPEGICIAVPIYYATKNKKKAFQMVLLSALSEPLGALFAFLFLENHLSNQMMGIFLAVVSGIMIALATTEIIPEALRHSPKYTIKYLFLGMGVIFLSHLLF